MCRTSSIRRGRASPMRNSGERVNAGPPQLMDIGGMGMSDELVVSHWFKRLTAIELMSGDSDTHLQAFIEASVQS